MNPVEVFPHVWLDAASLAPNPVFVEIGANSGRVSTGLLRTYGGVCHAYEPGGIRKKIAPFPGLTVIRKAVWDRDGVIEFCELPHQPQSSSVYARKPSKGRGEATTTRVRCVSLHRAFRYFRKVDYLYVNAEGAEWGILLSDAVLALSKVGQICIQFHTEFSEVPVEDVMTRLSNVVGIECQVVSRPYTKRPIVWGGKRS